MDIFNKKKVKSLQEKLNRYSKISDIEEEITQLQKKFDTTCNLRIAELDLREKNINKSEKELSDKKEDFSQKYKEAKLKFNELKQEVKIYENDLESISFGIYKPLYDYDTSEKYKEELIKIKDKQKASIKSKNATKCEAEWVVEGSATKGRQMSDRQSKLMLRAFNGECNSLITKVKWNNIDSIKQRIEKTFIAINKLGETNRIYIQKEFFNLRIKELNLAYEYEKKKQAEKEQQKEIKAQIREEEKLLRDIENAKRKAEKEEKLHQKALEKARQELGLATGEDANKLNEKIKKLEEELNIVLSEKERAISMAQQTRSGHVYIISNIGSFGKDIYKIGMTRRLEPLDRVKELGDASVPFKFDVHAMIYSDDAPTLEKKIHQQFKDNSVNLINFRKE